jgi:hypothetical protein
VEVTLDQFLDGVAENGLPKSVHTYFQYSEDHAIAACAIGQGVYNIAKDKSPEYLSRMASYIGATLDTIIIEPTTIRDKTVYSLHRLLARLNDTTNLSFKEIASEARKTLSVHDLKRVIHFA